MPGSYWTEAEKQALKRYVAEGLSARAMKERGYFEGEACDGKTRRSAMSIQKQMQRMGLVDPARSAMVRSDKARAWEGRDRSACIQDIVASWRTTPVETLASRWHVSAATIKYLLKQRGLGLSWKEAIQLKGSPFRNPDKRREWNQKLRANAQARRDARREQLVQLARRAFTDGSTEERRQCVGCGHVFPLTRKFFRATAHLDRVYFSHVCVVCSCERSGQRGADRENLMVKRNQERLVALRRQLLASRESVEERSCRRCHRPWPLDKRFFKWSRSRRGDKVLFEWVCRLCRAEMRRDRARQRSEAHNVA